MRMENSWKCKTQGSKFNVYPDSSCQTFIVAFRITVTGDKNVRMSSVAKYPICMLQSHPALHHTTPLLQANSSRQSASHSTTPSLSRSAALQGGRGESSTLAELQSFPGWDWGCTESPTEVTLKIRCQTPLTVMEPCLISHLNCKYFTPQH